MLILNDTKSEGFPMIPQSYHTFWRFFGDLCPTEQIAGHVLSKRDASQGPTLEHHPQPRIF
jgi:hypothetical protein